jgi:hypothetical protein
MSSAEFSFFISHSSATKELARRIYYDALANGVYPWYDEGLLNVGDHLEDEIKNGIGKSNGFLLLHCKAAMEKRWVPLEMGLAKAKYESDQSFRLMVVKLDDHPLEEFWHKFLYGSWNPEDQPGSILGVLEAILRRKGIVAITASATLTSDPAGQLANKSASLAEHTRNFVLWNLGIIKQLLKSSASVGRESELRDTITKILQLRLFEMIPSINGGVVPVEPGVIEIIHAARMRIPPSVRIEGLPSRYAWQRSSGNEVFTRIQLTDAHNGNLVDHPVPILLSVTLEADL